MSKSDDYAPTKFTLTVERDTGLWVVTSPEIPGLLVAEPVLREALEAVRQAILDLVLAQGAARVSC